MMDRKSLIGLDGDSYHLARAILSYLARHPKAMDSVEGIARFWLRGDFIEDTVEAVLTELVDRGLVRQTLKPDGGWIYGALPDPRGSGAS